MENPGVKCNVCECAYNVKSEKCSLTSINVTNEKTGSDCVSTPHFCKSFQKK